MNKLKEKIYWTIRNFSIKCYYWSDKKHWDLAGDEIAERVAKLFDVPVDMIHSQGHDHRKENKSRCKSDPTN
jgi:hypothetical protein